MKCSTSRKVQQFANTPDTPIFWAWTLTVSTMFSLSHMHEDHFDQTAERMIPKDMPIFLPKFDEQRIISKGFTKATVAVPTSTFTPVQRQHRSYNHTNPRQTTQRMNRLQRSSDKGTATGWYSGATVGRNRFIGRATLSSHQKFKNISRHLTGLTYLFPTWAVSEQRDPWAKLPWGRTMLSPLQDMLDPKKILPVHHSTYTLYLEPISKLCC